MFGYQYVVVPASGGPVYLYEDYLNLDEGAVLHPMMELRIDPAWAAPDFFRVTTPDGRDGFVKRDDVLVPRG